MAEAAPPAGSITEEEVASAVVRLSLALEQTTELMEAANELHLKLLDLQAVLSEPLVDLEGSLKEAREQATPKQRG
jgi:hypothetical protein